ncbi:hypothetical protein [Lentzea sp. NPDC004782]|uniref:hypothetical protein n=1 Tax=Lentzea sp. NPDC004782 TaxID=3154458 RepID=UPI0033AA1427
MRFIAPASKLYVGAAELAGLDTGAAADYTADRDAGKPADRTGAWRVLEDELVVLGKKKTDPALRLRRVFVHSSARAAAAATARAKKLDRARDDLERLARGLGSPYYPTEQTVTDRITAIARDRRVKAYLRSETGTDPATGKPTLS